MSSIIIVINTLIKLILSFLVIILGIKIGIKIRKIKDEKNKKFWHYISRLIFSILGVIVLYIIVMHLVFRGY